MRPNSRRLRTADSGHREIRGLKSRSRLQLRRTLYPKGKGDDFTLMENRKKKNKGNTKTEAAKLKPTGEPAVIKRKRLPKTQAVVLDKPTGAMTYADMVREVKTAVSHEALSFDIPSRRPKSGNLILETRDKEHADKLANVLKRKFRDSKGIRWPSLSTALLLISIEDSVDPAELKSVLEAHDSGLKLSNEIVIREGANGVRTTIVRVPLAPSPKLARLKKIRIGWATCRGKEMVARKGCAKCSGLGHSTFDCSGPETRRCFKCKQIGHLIASCNRSSETSEAMQSCQTQRVETLDIEHSTSYS